MKLLLLITIAGIGYAVPQDAACAACHKTQSEKHSRNAMSRALYTVADAEILEKHPKLEFQLGKYSYLIERRGKESFYRVSDGKDKIELALRFAFGQGAAGQTYVFEHQGQLHESRVSFFKELGRLDLTMGAPPGEPRNLVEAAGREMSPKDVTACFACHTTDSVVKGYVNFAGLQAGIGCASCHGSATAHLKTMAPMKKLSKLSAEEQSESCGRCHRTWADIAANGPRGINNVRFQPYRLANSKCYDADDRRIGCVGCHDAHAPLEKNLASYDGKCQACHAKERKVCPKGESNCASCHMPRFEIPGSNHQFTDHMIRIVRKNEAYPN